MSEPKTMFKTNSWNNKIEPVEVVKLTACFVTYKCRGWNEKVYERRESRNDFFDTWDQALSHLLDRATDKVQAARRALEIANSNLGNVKGMKNPAISNHKTEKEKV